MQQCGVFICIIPKYISLQSCYTKVAPNHNDEKRVRARGARHVTKSRDSVQKPGQVLAESYHSALHSYEEEFVILVKYVLL